MSKELKKINAYREFRTVAGINDIIIYLQTGNIPAGLNQRQTARYIEKYNQTGFIVRNIAKFQNFFIIQIL